MATPALVAWQPPESPASSAQPEPQPPDTVPSTAENLGSNSSSRHATRASLLVPITGRKHKIIPEPLGSEWCHHLDGTSKSSGLSNSDRSSSMQADLSILLVNYLYVVGQCAFQRDLRACSLSPLYPPASPLPGYHLQTRDMFLQRIVGLTRSLPLTCLQMPGYQDCVDETGLARQAQRRANS